MNLVGLAGSLRSGSFNASLIRAAAAAAPEGTILESFDGLGGIPPYNEDDREKAFPGIVTVLAGRIRAADGLVIATPEYNYGVPGVLKNAIDWLSRTSDQPFRHKPIGILGASMGNLGGARAQYDLRRYFIFLDGLVMNRPEVFVGAAHRKFDENGDLTDAPTRDFLGEYMVAFAAWVHRVR